MYGTQGGQVETTVPYNPYNLRGPSFLCLHKTVFLKIYLSQTFTIGYVFYIFFYKNAAILHHGLSPVEGSSATLCHGVPVEGDPHLHDFQLQRGLRVVGDFLNILYKNVIAGIRNINFSWPGPTLVKGTVS
jgi:hypothetical protein